MANFAPEGVRGAASGDVTQPMTRLPPQTSMAAPMSQTQPSDSELFDLIAQEALVDRATLKRELPLEDVGIESLDVISILFEIEDRYGIQVEDDEVGGCKTLGEMLDLFKSRLGAAA